MERSSRVYRQNSNSSDIICDYQCGEDVSNYNSSSSSRASDCNISLEVQIAESLERMITSPSRYSSAVLDIKLLKTNDKSSPKILLDKVDLPTALKKRDKLIEECKNKLKGNPSSKSIQQASHKRRDDRKGLRKSSYKQERKNINANSAPIDTRQFNYFAGVPSVVSRSVETIRDFCCDYDDSPPNPDKQGREMGDYMPSKKSSEKESTETSSDELMFYKPNLKEVGDTARQVYAAPKTSNIRDILRCQNSEKRNGNSKEPCLCQNCGIADVLIESQKRFIADETCTPPFEFYRPPSDRNPRRLRSRKDVRDTSDDGRGNPNTCVLNTLHEKLSVLESKFQQQEDKFITKEYLKVVVDKLISYLCPKVGRPVRVNRFVNAPLTRNISTQCSKSLLKRDVATLKITPNRPAMYNEYYVGSALSGSKGATAQFHSKCASIPEKETVQSVERSVEQLINNVENLKSAHRSDIFWRWGEEVIKPGFDLKSRITQLICETFSGNKPSKTETNTNKKPDIHVECASDKTLYLYGSENPAEQRNSKSTINDGTNFKKMLDIMSQKIYTDYIHDHRKNEILHDAEQLRYSRERAVNDNIFKQNIQLARKKAETFKREEIDQLDLSKKEMECIVVKKRCKDADAPNKNSASQKHERKSLIPKYKKKDLSPAKCASKVRVTYLSPKAQSWKEDSCMCFKVEQHFRKYIEGGANSSISRTGK